MDRTPHSLPGLPDDVHALDCAGLCLDIDRMRISGPAGSIFVNGHCLSLLYLLMATPGRIFSRPEILQALGRSDVCNLRTVDVYVRRLRALLRQVGVEEAIETIHDQGYRFAGRRRDGWAS